MTDVFIFMFVWFLAISQEICTSTTPCIATHHYYNYYSFLAKILGQCY